MTLRDKAASRLRSNWPGRLASRPWHVFFAGALPLLIFLRGSGSGATPRTGLWPLAAISILVCAIWCILAAVFRETQRAALVATVLALATFGYFVVADLAAVTGGPAVVAIAYVLIGLCLVVIARARKELLILLTVFANLIVLAATAYQTVVFAEHERRISVQLEAEIPLPLSGLNPRPGAVRPDIYILDLEGYGRADVLRDYYGFEDRLVPELESLGFTVAAEAAGNYPQMTQSLAAALNMDYLPPLLRAPESTVTLRRRLGELIAQNRFFAALHAAGYRLTSYESEYAFARPRPVDDRPGPLLRFTNFEYRLYESSTIPRVLELLGLGRGLIPLAVHHHQILWTLDHFGSEPTDGRPALVFAHVLMPHPPFAFEADGRVRNTRIGMAFNDGDQWRTLAQGRKESYEDGYLDGIRFLNARLPALVRRVIGRTSRPTIFCILSDHGPASRLRWEDPNPVSIRERHGILFAVRFADGVPPNISQRITPVNAYRILLNHALGTALPLLEDRSYFSTWERLSEYLDVTALVH
jgi:hypothetical protein